MTTTDTVLLIVLTSLLSIFTLLGIALMIIAINAMQSVKRVIAKAEDVVDSAEAVTDVFKDAQGRMALFKLIRNIFKLANKGRK
jgi:hypothetical protein